MKTFGIIHIVLFLLLMLVYQCSHAQDYAVTIKGDSLTGSIKSLSYGPDKKIQVTTADKKKNFIPLFQVKYYSINGEKFKPVKGPAGYTFMKLLKEGYLSLFAYQMENQSSYDGRFLTKKDGQGIEVPNLSFKKSLKNFLSDCSGVTSKIESGDLSRKDIEQIIDEYNACIEGRQIATTKQITQRAEQTQKLNPWDELEKKVNALTDLKGKSDALEMITEIKGKISRGEKVPNFMTEGLKSILTHPDVQTELAAALKEIQ